MIKFLVGVALFLFNVVGMGYLMVTNWAAAANLIVLFVMMFCVFCFFQAVKILIRVAADLKIF